jgi:methanogenic corrinoid protein MtbC1
MTREARGATAKDALRLRPESARLYLGARDAMLDEVNARMAAHPQIHALVGGNPLGMMYDNHRHHVDFLATVLQFNSFAMLDKVLPWVYRTYRAHGFSFDYFPLALAAWKQAVKNHIGPAEAAADIVALYDWMLTNHPLFVERSALVSDDEPPYPELAEERRSFGARLLAGDYAACLTAAQSILAREQGQTLLYLGLIQPVMYEIGRLWEQDKISTAEEHLATALVGRVLATLYAQLPLAVANRGRAVVTSAPNEYHELGARLLADLLEAAGWDVLFLGANTPAEALLNLLGKAQPRFVAISLTMPFGVGKVAEIISRIKAAPELAGVRVMVGGAAFASDPDLWRQIGADAWADHPHRAIQQAAQW